MAWKLLKNPAMQFVLLGAGLFGLHSLVEPGPASNPKTIILKQAFVEALVRQHEETHLTKVDDETYQAIRQEAIVHEVLYREALEQDLIRGDDVIRRHLIQKMHFILNARSRPDTPPEEELATWLLDHEEQYRLQERFSFTQVYLLPKSTKKPEVEKLIADGSLDPDFAWQQGDSFLRGYTFKRTTAGELDSIFGAGFASQLQEGGKNGGEDTWIGPITSSYGEHYVYLRDVVQGRIPHISEARAAVYEDLMKYKAEELKLKLIDEMAAEYTVISNDGDSVALNQERG